MCFSFSYENHDEAEFLYLLSPLSRVICYIINDYLCDQIQLLFSYLFNLSTVPKTWSKGVLSDIADITMGQSPAGNSYNIIGKGCPFYQGSTDFGAIFPAIRMYTNKPSRYASALDTLLSVRAPVGSLNIAFEDCCIGRGLASIHGKNANNTFVRYLLKNSKIGRAHV